MPTLAKSTKGSGSGSKSTSSKKTTSGKKTSKKSKAAKVPVEDQDVLSLSSPEEGHSDSVTEVVAGAEASATVPFSDGLVAACLKDLVVIPRVGGSEVDLLKGFLKYFATTELFLGSISNRLSFMKKKGGILL